jgi:hypothetical protein
MADISQLSLTERLFAFEAQDEDSDWEDLDIISLYQDLLDTGLIFSLQGSHQRFCGYLAGLGLVSASGDPVEFPAAPPDDDEGEVMSEDAFVWTAAATTGWA